MRGLCQACAVKIEVWESVDIETECISDHSDTNKRNNYLNLTCTLNERLVNYSFVSNN